MPNGVAITLPLRKKLLTAPMPNCLTAHGARRVNGPKLTNTCDDHIGSPSYGALP
jgi:hypothetical protein